MRTYNRRTSETRQSTSFPTTFVRMLSSCASQLLEELLKLSTCGNYPPKARAKQIAHFNHAWGVLLRRFCGQTDFTPVASVLLDATTKALQAALAAEAIRDEEEFDLAA